jgi:hypothetical protein
MASSSSVGVPLLGSGGVEASPISRPVAPLGADGDSTHPMADSEVGIRSAALPESMMAVLETSGRGGLDSVFDSLLHQLDEVLPARRWDQEPDWVDDWGRTSPDAPDATFDRFWDTDEEAESSRTTKEMITIAVLIPLVALAALGALVMTFQT